MSNDPNAAIYNNLNRIVSSFAPMLDPRVRAEGEQIRQNRELFPLKKEGMIADIGLTRARTGTEGFQQNYLQSGTNYNNARTAYQTTRNNALNELYNPNPAPRGSFVAPTTNYSYGADVGGPDELQDKWTNSGFSATGKNLTPGIVAVNPSKYPLGTVFKDAVTGETFIAGDKHGNADPNVIDFFQEPQNYQRSKTNRTLQIVGREGKVGRSPEEVRAQLAKYRQDASGYVPTDPQRQAVLYSVAGLDPALGMSGLARAEFMRGGVNEGRSRELFGAQGMMPNLTTATTPEYQQGIIQQGQQADYAKALDTERMKSETDILKTEMGGLNDIRKTVIDNATKGIGGLGAGVGGSALSVGDRMKLDEASSDAAYQAFGIPISDEGKGYDLESARPLAPFIDIYKSSLNKLVRAGVAMSDAMILANNHHFGTPDPVGSGKLEPGKRVNSFNQRVIDDDIVNRHTGGAGSIPGIGNITQLLEGIFGGGRQQEAPTAQVVSESPAPEIVQAAPALPGKVFTDPSKKLKESKNKIQREKDRNYNIQTGNNLGKVFSRITGEQGDPELWNSILSTIFSTEGNDDALREGLFQAARARHGSPVPQSGGIGGIPYDAATNILSSLPSFEDVRNFLSDDEALRYKGIDPEWVRKYRSGNGSGNAIKVGDYILE